MKTVFLAWFLWGITYSYATSSQLKPASRVHFIVVADANSQKGVTASLDAQRFENLIKEALGDGSTFTMHRLRGNGPLAPETVTGYLNSLSISYTEVLVFFFSGLGSYSGEEHLLQLSGGVLTRKQLRQVIEEKGARLSVLLTDCATEKADIFMRPTEELSVGSETRGLLHDLFFKQLGLVDINSNSNAPHEGSWRVASHSLFAQALIETLSRPFRSRMDRNQDGTIQWNEFLLSVRRRTQEKFASLRDEAGPDVIPNRSRQSIALFSLPVNHPLTENVTVIQNEMGHTRSPEGHRQYFIKLSLMFKDLKDQPLIIALYFKDEAGFLKDQDGQHANGGLVMFEFARLTPKSLETTYYKQIGIPQAQLHLAAGQHQLRPVIAVYTHSDSPRLLAAGEFEDVLEIQD